MTDSDIAPAPPPIILSKSLQRKIQLKRQSLNGTISKDNICCQEVQKNVKKSTSTSSMFHKQLSTSKTAKKALIPNFHSRDFGCIIPQRIGILMPNKAHEEEAFRDYKEIISRNFSRVNNNTNCPLCIANGSWYNCNCRSLFISDSIITVKAKGHKSYTVAFKRRDPTPLRHLYLMFHACEYNAEDFLNKFHSKYFGYF